MYGRSRPPDVVPGTGGFEAASPELESAARRPSDWTRTAAANDHAAVKSSCLTSSPVMTSPSPLTSTPDGGTDHRRPRRTGTAPATRHVDFRLDESAAARSSSDVEATGCGSVPVRRPSELEVGPSPPGSSWNDRRRRQVKSIIVIGEEDVDEMFQPVSIKGDSFALLQTSARCHGSTLR